MGLANKSPNTAGKIIATSEHTSNGMMYVLQFKTSLTKIIVKWNGLRPHFSLQHQDVNHSSITWTTEFVSSGTQCNYILYKGCGVTSPDQGWEAYDKLEKIRQEKLKASQPTPASSKTNRECIRKLLDAANCTQREHVSLVNDRSGAVQKVQDTLRKEIKRLVKRERSHQ